MNTKTKKIKIIGITLTIILVALTIALAGIMGYYKNISENADNDSFCEDCPEITQEELEAGWYWGFIDQKKPGTPDTWLHINEGTRSAMWCDPSLILVKP